MAPADLNPDDELLFADDTPEPGRKRPRLVQPWRMLVVDDEPDVHRVTRMVLSDFSFEGRPLEILSAYSGAEARLLLSQSNDIAVILLDVVMETDDAGLTLVRQIRQDLRNENVRIVLRTGQPGMAPEQTVIVEYDINDYKSKAELTAQKLFTTIVAALRSYRDLVAIEQGRKGLEKVLEASTSLFELRSTDAFLAGILDQINALLDAEGGSILCTAGDELPGSDPTAVVRAAAGRFADLAGKRLAEIPHPTIVHEIVSAFARGSNQYLDDHCAVFFKASGEVRSVAFIEATRPLSPLDHRLVDLFCAKASIAYDNVLLQEHLGLAQEATVFALARLAEFKDPTTGDHLHRVELMTNKIALEMQRRGLALGELDDVLVKKIGLASILHDVGKVGVPDNILCKAGGLDETEWLTMRRHASLGAEILQTASRRLRGRTFLSIGAEIALGHHEKWNGTGYPRGLKGKDIPLSARIVAVADVFDALTSKRPYKEAWDRQDAIDWIKARVDIDFDPDVVTAFLGVVEG